MQEIARDSETVEGLPHQAIEEMASLRARLREKPADLAARVDLARTLMECGDLSEAFIHLRIALAPGGQRGQASYLMGLAHIWTGDHSAAVDDLLLAIRLLPAYAPAMAALDKALAGIVEVHPRSTAAPALAFTQSIAPTKTPTLELAHSAAA